MRTLIYHRSRRRAGALTSILHFGGMPITARFIYREISARLPKPAAPQTLEAVS